MAKVCLACNKEMGILSGKVKLSDGYVCVECWKKAGFGTGFSDLTNTMQYSSSYISSVVNAKIQTKLAMNNFSATTKVGSIMEFCAHSETFIITTVKGFKKDQELFNYNQILNFELLEDGENITKGGLGRAVVGGFLLGGVGAIVGGVTGGKKTKSLCNSLKLKITFRECYRQTIYIDLISTQTKTSSMTYKTAYKTAQEAISALQIACDQISRNSTCDEKIFSEADELTKFKKLLDEGIINEVEFNAKKKQLLGL